MQEPSIVSKFNFYLLYKELGLPFSKGWAEHPNWMIRTIRVLKAQEK